MPASLQFPNPPLAALRSTQQHLAMTSGKACKYHRHVSPFAGLDDNSHEALAGLFSLLEPGESTYVVSEVPLVLDGLESKGPVGVLQMTYPADLPLPLSRNKDGVALEGLSSEHSAEMVELTSIAFPGFFRPRTWEMGNYYGIRQEGRLVAMCGERMAIGEFREISGLCTHPEARGRGYAALLMTRLMEDHRAAGLRSYLHVAANNQHAADLYRRMGFEDRGEFPMYLVTRTKG